MNKNPNPPFMVASRSTTTDHRAVRLGAGVGEALVEIPHTASAAPGLTDQEVMFRMWAAGRPWGKHQVVMRKAEEALMREILGCDCIEGFLINPKILATFQPQAWQNDYAIDIDGAEVFDALPVLLKWTFGDVAAMLSARDDFDDLASDLAARKAHNGPFEVRLHNAAAIPVAVKLLLGRPVTPGDRHFCTGSDLNDLLDEAQWDEFRSISSEVITLRESIRGGMETSPPAPTRVERLEAEVARLNARIADAHGVVSILYGALDDASSVVDAGSDERYAYQAELEAGASFLGIERDSVRTERPRSAS